MFFTSKFSIYVATEKFTDDIFLSQSGWESCAPGHCCIGLVRDHYLLHFVASGKGEFHSDGKAFRLGAGEGFIIRPGEVTEYYADKEAPWEYCWFGFNGIKAREALRMMGIQEDAYIFQFSGMEAIRSIEGLHKAVMASANKGVSGTGLLMIVIDELIRSMGSGGDDKPVREYARAAVDYIEFNYFRDITVEGLAEMVSLDRSHFYRIFHDEMGVSPKEYLIECRMKNARRLLAESNLSVADVACAVGYQDPVNFSKMFRAKVGISPGKYRKVRQGTVLCPKTGDGSMSYRT